MMAARNSPRRTDKTLRTEPPNWITADAVRPNAPSLGRLPAHLAGMIVAGVWSSTSICHWARLYLRGRGLNTETRRESEKATITADPTV